MLRTGLSPLQRECILDTTNGLGTKQVYVTTITFPRWSWLRSLGFVANFTTYIVGNEPLLSLCYGEFGGHSSHVHIGTLYKDHRWWPFIRLGVASVNKPRNAQYNSYSSSTSPARKKMGWTWGYAFKSSPNTLEPYRALELSSSVTVRCCSRCFCCEAVLSRWLGASRPKYTHAWSCGLRNVCMRRDEIHTCTLRGHNALLFSVYSLQ